MSFAFKYLAAISYLLVFSPFKGFNGGIDSLCTSAKNQYY